MQIFRNPNFDFIGKKFIFLGISAALLVISLVSLLFGRGIPFGVDFRGGTIVYVRFAERPNEDQIRRDMQQAGLPNTRIQRYGDPNNNEVLIALDQQVRDDQSLDQGRQTILRALETNNPLGGKRDLNNTGRAALQDWLMQKDPLRAGTDAQQRYSEIAQRIIGFRDSDRGGVIRSLDDLTAVVPPAVLSALKQDFGVSKFGIRNVEVVGPQVGSQLRTQALLATLYSLAGMLVYIWFRFELMYGAASVLAVFHDTIITLGVFSLLNEEVSLTVIAAMLTLIGYSMNDTIVIFDRVRENLKLLRRERFDTLVNTSINQTLSRTILTSGLTFLTVLSLFLFGGEVLRGFSLALVVGILIGTYSSFGFAAPVLVLWQDWKAKRMNAVAVPAEPSRSSRKGQKIRA